jgi:AcrR family transcriptional regulator
MSKSSLAETVGDLQTLPPGRHGIAPELVIDHQRQRLLAGAAAAFVEEGYASLSVASVTSRARVSRATFYKLFDDKLDCVLATHTIAFQRLERNLRDSCMARPSWPEAVVAAIRASLDFAAASPAEAGLLAFAPIAAEPQLTSQALEANAQLLAMLRAGRERCPEAEAPGELAEQALLMGVMHVIGAELAAGRAGRLSRMAPEFAQILLTPYLGEGAAKRAATAS